MINVSITRTNQMIILDYEGIVLVLTNATMTYENSVNIIFDYVRTDYIKLKKLFDECTSPIKSDQTTKNYKKIIRIIINDFDMTLYGAFISSINIDSSSVMEMELVFDHTVYNFDSTVYNYYIPYLRRLKIKRIQSKIKKELVMN